MAVVLALALLSTSLMLAAPIRADESGGGGFDMSALASIASNLGSNPQIMSMVSSLFNDGAQSISKGSPSSSISALGAASGQSFEQDNPAVQESPASNAQIAGAGGGATSPQSGGSASGEPLKRYNSRQSNAANANAAAPTVQTTTNPTNTTTAAANVAPSMPASSSSLQLQAQLPPASVSAATATVATGGEQSKKPELTPASGGGAVPFSGLMSLLPSVLPNLGNLGALGGLLGNQQQSKAATTTATAGSRSSLDQATATQLPSAPTNGFQQQQQQQQGTPTAAAAAAVAPALGSNPAQAVINQVLTAYASGQIPNELIQLGLSGRVPPQIIEFALSGQVPSQLIQMVITGQIPMATINAFLASMQGGNGASSGFNPQPAAPQARQMSTTISTLGSTTRAIFEALFNRPSSSGHQGGGGGGGTSPANTITVPTLLGPLPIQMPSFPNMRRIGQMVGGTISNVASMIPF